MKTFFSLHVMLPAGTTPRDFTEFHVKAEHQRESQMSKYATEIQFQLSNNFFISPLSFSK